MRTLDPSAFLRLLFEALEQDGIDVRHLLLDHVCYRVASMGRYTAMKERLAGDGTLLGEHVISGRTICTFRLHEPFVFRGRSIDVIELPAPKAESPYIEGFEHAEFVVEEDPLTFALRYPHLAWVRSGARKTNNADVRLHYTGFSVKFHQQALAEVIEAEQRAIN